MDPEGWLGHPSPGGTADGHDRLMGNGSWPSTQAPRR